MVHSAQSSTRCVSSAVSPARLDTTYPAATPVKVSEPPVTVSFP